MANLNTYRHETYDGGLNDTSSPDEIERNEASVLYNWDITYEGRLTKRDGALLVGDDQTSPIDGANAFLRTGGGKDILTMEGGSLRYLNISTFDELDDGFTTNRVTGIEYCPLNDKVYMGNNSDTLHSWNRVSVVKNACLTDLTSAVPSGSVLRWHKNHMFVSNNAHVGASTFEHRLYWSAIGDPDTWDTVNDFIEVPGNGRMLALADLGDALVLFKEYSINYLTGWGDTDWRITATSSNTATLDESIGIAGAKAHTRVGNEVWFMDDEGIIRRIYQTDFDAYRSDIISKKIQRTLDTMNLAQLSKVCAHTWNDKVYFAVPTGSNVFNDTILVFDIKASKRNGGQEAWTTYRGWFPTNFFDYPTSTTPQLYWGDKNGSVFRHAGVNDGALLIDSRWDSKNDAYEKEERWKRYKFGYITGLATGDIDVEVHASVDDASFADLGDLNLTGEGGTLGPTGLFELGPTGTTAVLGGSNTNEFKFYFASGGGAVRGKRLTMSIRHAIVSEKPVVNGFTTHFKIRQLR